ncbi:MAG: ABC transporter permease, partial [Acutalibacteraceae bacterium]
KNAFRIGISGMKFKKFRLVITILLSCVAFSLFGLSDVFSAYDYTTTAVSSMIDSKIEYATLMKHGKGSWGGDAQLGTITKKELDELSKSLGVQFGGVFTPPEPMDFSMYFAEESDARQIIVSEFCGFAEADEATLKSYGYKLLCGSMSNGARDEILVSDAVAYSFKGKTLADQAGKSQKIATAADMVGKKINFADGDYTVTGVFDTGFDIAKYERLNKQIEKEGSLWTYGQIQQMALTAEDSLCSAALTGKGFIQRKAADYAKYARSLNTVDYRFEAATDDWYSYEANEICYYTKLSSVDRRKIVWANGEKKSLAPGEIILSLNTLTTSLSSADSGNAPTMEDLQKLISTTNFSYKEFATDSKGVSHEKQSMDSIKVVGIYDDSDGEALPDGIHCLCIVNDDKFDYQLTPCSELYNRVIGTMPTDRSGIEKIMKYCRAGKKVTDTHYTLENPVINELSMTDSTIKTLAKIFLYIGLGFAVFAAIMLANFIATSISRKKREIGILRAIGSRSADVFRIFFSEAFVIAMINFLLSAILVGVAVVCINSGVRQATGLMLTLLTFGVRQVALVLLVSVVVAALACFLPVRHIAAKRPIDAIRDR